LELAEHLSKISAYASQMGKTIELSHGDMFKLLEKRASIGLGPEGRKKSSEKEAASKAGKELTDLKQIIKEEVKKVLSV
jgi:hypothetical protein